MSHLSQSWLKAESSNMPGKASPWRPGLRQKLETARPGHGATNSLIAMHDFPDVSGIELDVEACFAIRTSLHSGESPQSSWCACGITVSPVVSFGPPDDGYPQLSSKHSGHLTFPSASEYAG